MGTTPNAAKYQPAVERRATNRPIATTSAPPKTKSHPTPHSPDMSPPIPEAFGPLNAVVGIISNAERSRMAAAMMNSTSTAAGETPRPIRRITQGLLRPIGIGQREQAEDDRSDERYEGYELRPSRGRREATPSAGLDWRVRARRARLS